MQVRSSLLVHLLKRPRPFFQKYLVALLIQSSSIWLTLELDRHQLGHLYSLNLVATVLATMYGGLGPGLLAAFLGALGLDFYFVEPRFSIELHNPLNILRMVLYFSVSFSVSWLVDSLHKAYATAEENRKNAEQSRRSREELLAILSHDLRSPLAGIRLSAQALQLDTSRIDQVKINELSAAIIRTSERLTRLIVDILDATKIEAGGIALTKDFHDVTEMIEESKSDFIADAKERGVRIETNLSTSKKKIYCDRIRILQVLSNMLGNAVKFVPENGLIKLEVEFSDQEWKFSVIDNGPGIPSAYLPHLFKKHWQPKEHHGKGIGLGLYIAKGIVEGHGGNVSVKSSLGTGSCFCFALPDKTAD